MNNLDDKNNASTGTITITYEALLCVEQDKYTILLQDIHLPENSTSGATEEEAKEKTKNNLTQYATKMIETTGVPPEPKPIDPSGVEGAKQIEITINIVNPTFEQHNIFIKKSLIDAFEKEASGHDTDYSGYLNELIIKDLGLKSQGQSFFYRSLIRLTNNVKSAIHDSTLAFYGKSSNKKTKEDLPFQKDKHYKTSVDVYHRLLLRYAILRDAEKLEMRYGVHNELSKNKVQPTTDTTPSVVWPCTTQVIYDSAEDRNRTKIDPALRAYKLATTDVFVEKAIAYLEDDSDKYQIKGNIAFTIAAILLFFSVFISGFSYLGADFSKVSILGITLEAVNQSAGDAVPAVGKFSRYSSMANQKFLFQGNLPNDATLEIKVPPGSNKPTGDKASAFLSWRNLVAKFIQGFTFYGLLILSVVGFWRIGRAMLDQSERLKDRRHALRQGRLYVHLNDGVLKPDELEKVFAWNKEGDNAFGKIPTEASAPWGGVFKDAFKAMAEVFGKHKKD